MSADVQDEVAKAFKQQEQEFKSSSQDEIVFDGNYKPDDGECLVIKDFDDIDKLRSAITNPLSVPEIHPNAREFANIKALFSGDPADPAIDVLIQSFDRRKIISTTGLSLFHSGNVYKKVDGVGITLDTRLSAILTGSDLKFFSFHAARQLFDLMDYYKEATDDDINEFSKIPSLQVDQKKLVGFSDAWVRRKIALVMQSEVLDKIDTEETKREAAVFGIDLRTTEIAGKLVIVLPDDKPELKRLLRFLDEDYYTSVLLRQPFISNSKRPA